MLALTCQNNGTENNNTDSDERGGKGNNAILSNTPLHLRDLRIMAVCSVRDAVGNWICLFFARGKEPLSFLRTLNHFGSGASTLDLAG